MGRFNKKIKKKGRRNSFEGGRFFDSITCGVRIEECLSNGKS